MASEILQLVGQRLARKARPTWQPDPRTWAILAGTGAVATAIGGGVIGALGTSRRHDAAQHPDRRPGLPRPDDGGKIPGIDGLPLAYASWGDYDAPVSIILTHGYCQQSASWFQQVDQLRAECGPRVRIIVWDQRGHGRSGEPPADTCTLNRTADDLRSIIDTLVPTGKLILIGHSMGGMTTMAFIRRFPQYRDRFQGVGLISTAASQLARSGMPQMMDNPLVRMVKNTAGAVPVAAEQVRRLITGWLWPAVRGGSFGSGPMAQVMVDFNASMINDTPIPTIVNFFPALYNHDERETVDGLDGIAGVVVCGEEDLMTPLEQSKRIIAAWEGAEFITVPKAGHMVHLQRPEVVTEAIVSLLDDDTAAKDALVGAADVQVDEPAQDYAAGAAGGAADD